MPGFIFIIFLWCLWIISTFMMDKTNPNRWNLAFCSLMLLLLYPLEVPLGSLTFNAAALLLLFIGFSLVGTFSLSQKIYMSISALIIMLGYTGFQMLEMLDPIWVVFDRKLMLAACLFIMTWILYPGHYLKRYCAAVIGMITGEIIYGSFLSQWGMPYIIGSGEFLDAVVFALLLIMCNQVFSIFLNRMKNYTQLNVHSKKQMIN